MTNFVSFYMFNLRIYRDLAARRINVDQLVSTGRYGLISHCPEQAVADVINQHSVHLDGMIMVKPSEFMVTEINGFEQVLRTANSHYFYLPPIIYTIDGDDFNCLQFAIENADRSDFSVTDLRYLSEADFRQVAP